MPIVFANPFIPPTWNLDDAEYDSLLYDTVIPGTTPASYGMTMSNDGTRGYITDDGSNGLRQVNFSTGWDITTASNGGFTSVSGQNGVPQAIAVSDDGSKLYMYGGSGSRLYQYNMNTPFLLSSIIFEKSEYTGPETLGSRSIRWKPDGSKLFLMNNTGTIYQYDVGTAWDIASMVYNGNNFVAPEGYGMDFKPDGTIFYNIGSNTDLIHQYTLNTPWDISSAVDSGQTIDTSPPDSGPTDIKWNPDGTRFFIYGFSTRTFYQYSL